MARPGEVRKQRVREGSLVSLYFCEGDGSNRRLHGYGIVFDLSFHPEEEQRFRVFWSNTGRKEEKGAVRWGTYELNYSPITQLEVISY